MEVKEIVQNWLEAREYDGLYNSATGCRCDAPDIMGDSECENCSHCVPVPSISRQNAGILSMTGEDSHAS